MQYEVRIRVETQDEAYKLVSLLKKEGFNALTLVDASGNEFFPL